ncbi:hypothetical protein C8R45DRAFT_1089411 [Mycena sanguinolenta]|nr:hypothetical protein C8R45DRAFT_1113400 [Mycena sanguinolenta]KAJ6484086.1 hypothetical protein C8R45DRAFT_931536 [Mycena sanguinolenta]KAJ6508208.1 hypothetical protein C8R45DRAFT_1089411 [Mycena sanguinolenta]
MHHPWAPTEDKALKSEALRCVEKSTHIPTKLATWLEFYDPKRAGRSPTDHQHKREALVARVAAKKARGDKLTELRTRALQAAARKWPRPRCHPQHPDNQARLASQRQKEERRRKAERAAERAAADARVAYLMELRARALKPRHKK